MRRSYVFFLASVALGAIAFACGSSDDSGGGSATADGGSDDASGDRGSTPPPPPPPAPPPVPGDAAPDADADALPPFDGGVVAAPHLLAAGNTHTCRIKAGAIKCWGQNTVGQLGSGSTSGMSPPVDVTGITNAVEIAAGYDFTCARLATGGVKCWGDADSGKLGNNVGVGHSATPVDVVNLTDAIAIAAGEYHACALRSDHHIVCWGDNSWRIGDGKDASQEPYVGVPTEPVPAITDGVAIGAGWGQTCVLRSTGSAKCWGSYNAWGQIGAGNKLDQPTPVDVVNLTTGDQLGAGTYHTCARLTDAAVQCWGNNQGGEIGIGTSDSLEHSSPVNAINLPPVALLQVNGFGTCAITAAGVPYCWGGNAGSAATITSPAVVSGLGQTVEIAGFSTHSCARLANDQIWCWGDNQYGELGADAGPKSDVPVLAPGL
jgi:alpha-tubulin suppressor-like RCC1 family protein